MRDARGTLPVVRPLSTSELYRALGHAEAVLQGTRTAYPRRRDWALGAMAGGAITARLAEAVLGRVAERLGWAANDAGAIRAGGGAGSAVSGPGTVPGLAAGLASAGGPAVPVAAVERGGRWRPPFLVDSRWRQALCRAPVGRDRAGGHAGDSGRPHRW